MSTSISADAIVVGAGVVGASCAYHLARAGARVLVAETFAGDAGVVLLARKTAQ